MTQSEFDQKRNDLNEVCLDIMAKKRPDYAYASTDVLNNFRRTAERTGTTPGVVWAVFFAKHVDAIIKAMTQGGENSEPLIMRFADCRNYIDLGWALWAEAEQQRNTRGYDDSQKQALLKRVQEHFAAKEKEPQASNTFNGEPWPPAWVTPKNTAEHLAEREHWATRGGE